MTEGGRSDRCGPNPRNAALPSSSRPRSVRDLVDRLGVTTSPTSPIAYARSLRASGEKRRLELYQWALIGGETVERGLRARLDGPAALAGLLTSVDMKS